MPMHRQQRKQQDSRYTQEELKMLQARAGRLNWLGHGVLPTAAYISSLLPQETGDLRVQHLTESNRALPEIRKLQPELRYKAPSNLETRESEAALLAFSDASRGKGSYGQTGCLCGILFSSSEIYHEIDLHNSKQGHVTFSSIGAEILGAAEWADRAGLMAFDLNRSYESDRQLPLVLTVELHGICSTISTLHEGRDYRLIPTVERIGDSFETVEISVLQWMPGTKNPADEQTKKNLDPFRLNTKICATGTIPDLLHETERINESQQ